jgi:hypothetical protein
VKYIIQKKSGRVNVRKHDRKTKNSTTDVVRHDRSRPTSKRSIGQTTGYIPLEDLNYKQAKKRYPFLNPSGDIDNDGVINKRDCHPFDTSRQDDDAQDLIEQEEAEERREAQIKIWNDEREERMAAAINEAEEQKREQERIKEWGISQNRENRGGLW